MPISLTKPTVAAAAEAELEPARFDFSWDFKVGESRFYARDDIDRKVYLPSDQWLWGETVSGEMKTYWEDETPT